jgi:RimJ/RimL family protein N-acetyltransferase
MAEALPAARDWFFEKSDCVEFIAVTQEANERTRQLLLRVGSIETRTFEQYGLPQVEYTFQPITAPEV